MKPKPLNSMTGFGAGAVERDGCRVGVEIRAVNNRGLKLNVKSRPSLAAFEKNLRDRVAEALPRGSVDVFVQLVRRPDAEAAREAIDPEAARAAVAALRALGRELELPGELSVRDLLFVPGLFGGAVDSPVSEAEWLLIDDAARAALEQVSAMRAAEGAALSAALATLVEPIEAFARDARAWAPAVVERARARLEARLAELFPDGQTPGDRQALEREICFHAERADIREELDRLDSHVAQYRALLAKGGECGKRIEFLAQEFLREINTTASKAADPDIARRAVDAKLAVEKIKEQSANVE